MAATAPIALGSPGLLHTRTRRHPSCQAAASQDPLHTRSSPRPPLHHHRLAPQRYWAWNGLDTSFKEQTSLMGDIHHYAWRAKGLNETVYLDPADLRKFGEWTVQECWTEECVEAHTNVDVIVDLEGVKALLDSRLPLVFEGKSVQEASLPWPLSGSEGGEEEEEEEGEQQQQQQQQQQKEQERGVAAAAAPTGQQAAAAPPQHGAS
jgi:hypothetical protein